MLTKNGKNSYRTLGRCAFATILCSLLFAAGCGGDDSSSSSGNSCTKNATKCGEGADANKLYTCTDEATFDKGVDCAANDSHKVCGGDTVKACVCDTQNGYVDNNGTCEKPGACKKGSTKCGEGADANKLYTCTDEATFDKGVDCAANDSHKVCGGDTVKACVCDAKNNYVDRKGGTCELKKKCDDELYQYNPDTNDCDCDLEKAVLVKDQCEKRQVCDVDGQIYVEASNTCACDEEKHWKEGDDGCVCDDAHRVNRGGVCECDDENHWTEGSDGSCVCEKIFFNDQCVDVQGTVTFGNYPQATETPDPIEWIVLAHQDNKLLLLSKYVIDAKQFDARDTYPTWAESDIRKWLNDAETGFMSVAFSSAEQAMIAEVTNSTSDYGNPTVNEGGEDTTDKVFLLDSTDVKNEDYFKDKEALLAQATAYIVGKACLPLPSGKGCSSNSEKNQCTHLSCTAGWWLRSPKYLKTDAMYISYYYDSEDANGIFDSETVDTSDIGVRPALWVSLSSEF